MTDNQNILGLTDVVLLMAGVRLTDGELQALLCTQPSMKLIHLDLERKGEPLVLQHFCQAHSQSPIYPQIRINEGLRHCWRLSWMELSWRLFEARLSQMGCGHWQTWTRLSHGQGWPWSLANSCWLQRWGDKAWPDLIGHIDPYWSILDICIAYTSYTYLCIRYSIYIILTVHIYTLYFSSHVAVVN